MMPKDRLHKHRRLIEDLVGQGLPRHEVEDAFWAIERGGARIRRALVTGLAYPTALLALAAAALWYWHAALVPEFTRLLAP